MISASSRLIFLAEGDVFNHIDKIWKNMPINAEMLIITPPFMMASLERELDRWASALPYGLKEGRRGRIRDVADRRIDIVSENSPHACRGRMLDLCIWVYGGFLDQIQCVYTSLKKEEG